MFFNMCSHLNIWFKKTGCCEYFSSVVIDVIWFAFWNVLSEWRDFRDIPGQGVAVQWRESEVSTAVSTGKHPQGIP